MISQLLSYGCDMKKVLVCGLKNCNKDDFEDIVKNCPWMSNVDNLGIYGIELIPDYMLNFIFNNHVHIYRVKNNYNFINDDRLVIIYKDGDNEVLNLIGLANKLKLKMYIHLKNGG